MQDDDPVEVDALSVAEVKAAIEAFSKADNLRLSKVARAIAKRHRGINPDDLLHEAFVRALTGIRSCPRSLNVSRFLGGTMKSIASKGKLKSDNEDAMSHLDSSSIVDDSLYAIPKAASPQDELIAIETLEQTIELFANDDEATMLLMAKQDDMTPDAIQTLLNMDAVRYNTVLRRIRRRYEKLTQGDEL